MTAAPHWARLEIRRFRGLASLDLDALAAFNVLIGANDVGKTSVLEAVFLLSGSANIELPLRVQNLRSYIVPDVNGFDSLFFGLEIVKGIELSAHVLEPPEHRKLMISAPREDTTIDIGPLPADASASTHSSSIPQGRRVLRYDATIAKSEGDLSSLSFSGKLVPHADTGFTPQMSSDSASDSIVPAHFLGAGSAYDAGAIADVIVRKKDETLLEYLQLINPQITKIAANGELGYLDIGLDKMLPMNMFGSGMIRACSVLSRCILGDDRILLVDEIERGLHHAAILPLLKTLLHLTRNPGIQMYVTTHSLSMLQGLQKVLGQDEMADYRDSVACYALQRDSSGTVRAYRYSYPELDHCIRHGIEIR